MKPIQYGNFTDEFVEDLTTFIAGRRVLEVFSGNGFLASLLSARGVNIVATSLLSGHDGHSSGMYHPVEELEASEAIVKHGAECEVLLMSWPVTSPAALHCADLWVRQKSSRPIVFIGEMPRADCGKWGGLPGCACDDFFESIGESVPFEAYAPRNLLDQAVCISSFNYRR